MASKISKSLSNVDGNTEYLIYGYTRQCEVVLDLVIPELISYAILVFYWIDEYFDIVNDKIRLSDDKRTLRSTMGILENSNYGFQ